MPREEEACGLAGLCGLRLGERLWFGLGVDAPEPGPSSLLLLLLCVVLLTPSLLEDVVTVDLASEKSRRPGLASPPLAVAVVGGPLNRLSAENAEFMLPTLLSDTPAIETGRVRVALLLER